MSYKVLTALAVVSLSAAAQIHVIGVTPTATQAILQYESPVLPACSLKVADMNRSITIVSAAQNNGQVTIGTSVSHGLLPGAVIYLENTSVAAWNGWQTVTAVPSLSSFTFANTINGAAGSGNVGVLVDDVNPALFPGADQDSRPGNVSVGGVVSASGADSQQLNPPNGKGKAFVIGRRDAETAADGNRYSRALQANSRHHYTLTCGSQSYDQEFTTLNVTLGDTYNQGLPVDRTNPGHYAYPTIQWSNQKQALIDPVSGLRSFRATEPSGAASGNQNFVTALDTNSVWQNVNGPLTSGGGAATFTAPCPNGNCPLLLRADTLNLNGGNVYSVPGNSLDWVTVAITQASINNASCTGDDCKLVACLTVNGVACASANQEISLTGTPATYTLGSGKLMDLWQGTGAPRIARPDVSQANGSANYTAATKVLNRISGSPFNITWTAGSQITVAGTQYTIASVQNEVQLTLANGPASNLNGAAFSAGNFGVLLWKKTAQADQISIGYTTFQYGSTSMPGSGTNNIGGCSGTVVVNSVSGYNCFVDNELYWVAADGSDIRDLGLVALSYYNVTAKDWKGGSLWLNNQPCGISSNPNQFDPQNGDTWYCSYELGGDPNQTIIIQAHYSGSHNSYTNGLKLPDCSQNQGAQPCLQFTVMTPEPNCSLTNNVQPCLIYTNPIYANATSQFVGAGVAQFSPQFQASGYQAGYWIFAGVSSDGELLMYSRTVEGQDSRGWLVLYSLGDRTPAGTGPNSMKIIAATSSYQTAPFSWCSVHNLTPPAAGVVTIYSNDLSIRVNGIYVMTLTSPLLAAGSGQGGLSMCPANPLGVTGQVCTAITVSGEPQVQSTGVFLQATQVGDVIKVDSEFMRIVAKTSSTSLVVQRGYAGSVAAHSGTTLTMGCGSTNTFNARATMWDYRDDPYGTNGNGNTVIADPTQINSHSQVSPQFSVFAAGQQYLVGPAICPNSAGVCYLFRPGYGLKSVNNPLYGVTQNPTFSGTMGVGLPNQVDSHPGPCVDSWCLDARPMDGGSTSMAGSTGTPWANVAGQLWKFQGSQSILHRKLLATMAYVGRFALVDVSGVGSVIGTGSQDSYKYCVVAAAGECVAGSAVGDVYVNAPYVGYPYCWYAGIGVQADDTNSICVGDLGAHTGNVVQVLSGAQDMTGIRVRRLGPNYAKWNQQDVYWNLSTTPAGELMFSQVRWLDGVRFDDLITMMPPLPPTDSVARNTFVAVPVQPGRSNSSVHDAIVEFGYAENGDPGNFYCTSRQEACVATSGTVNQTMPFYYEQSESYAGVPCPNGCTITIPALTQHVVYYRWKYRDSSGQVIATSETRALTVP